MSLMCTWKGVHKRPNRENTWVNGTVRRKPTSIVDVKTKRETEIDPKEEPDNYFQFFVYDSE